MLVELHVVDLLVERIKAVMSSFVEKDCVPAGPNDDLLKAGLVGEGLINKYGGAMPNAMGVPEDQIHMAVTKYGVCKVNIDTDLRMASTGAIRQFFAEHPKEFDPRKYLAAATKAMYGICKARYEAFGTAGWASKITPLSLEVMTTRYAKGELDPKIN